MDREQRIREIHETVGTVKMRTFGLLPHCIIMVLEFAVAVDSTEDIVVLDQALTRFFDRIGNESANPDDWSGPTRQMVDELRGDGLLTVRGDVRDYHWASITMYYIHGAIPIEGLRGAAGRWMNLLRREMRKEGP